MTRATRRAPAWLPLHPDDLLFYFIIFFPFYFPRGHRAYLSSAPRYDFPRYRQLVHELTLAFSRISREVLQLQGRLRDQHGRPELAQHLARLQEREQEKLQLVSARGWGGDTKHRTPPPTPGVFSAPLRVPAADGAAPAGAAAGAGRARRGRPPAGGAGAQAQVGGHEGVPPTPPGSPLPQFWGPGPPPRAGILRGAPLPAFSSAPSLQRGRGGPRWCLQKLSCLEPCRLFSDAARPRSRRPPRAECFINSAGNARRPR